MEIPKAPSEQNSSKKRRSKGASRACPHCLRHFKRIEHLDRHVRTHTKEKPFVCQCGAAYTRRDLLTRHYRREGHQDASDRPSEAANDLRVELGSEVGDGHGGVDATEYTTHASHGHSIQHFDNHMYDQNHISTFSLDRGTEFPAFGQFSQFAYVLGGLGLPDEWSPQFHFDTAPDATIFSENAVNYTPDNEQRPARVAESGASQEERAGTPFTAWLPSAPVGNQVSITTPERRNDNSSFASTRWYISTEQRDRLVDSVDAFRHAIDPNFSLPSRHTLTRYLTIFFGGFNKNLPFIHHTWRPLDEPIELLLAIGAIGARECCENRTSEELFVAGKAIQLCRLRREVGSFGPKSAACLGLYHNSHSGTTAETPPSQQRYARDSSHSDWDPVDAVRGVLLLLCYATWENKLSLVQDSIGLANLLAQLLSEVGLDETEEHHEVPMGWKQSMELESSRRAKLSAISFLVTMSIAYDILPPLRPNEINLQLPCSSKEWEAANQSQWQAVAQEVQKPQLLYNEALHRLVTHDGNGTPLDPIPSSFGNYLLMHGLVQRIITIRDVNASPQDSRAALPDEDVEKLERALRAWTLVWQLTPESSVDPSDDVSRISSTSSGMLALAYARIHLDIGPYRELGSRDPRRMAMTLNNSPPVRRGEVLTSALLYATHTLSIPVRLGIDRVARHQVFFWTIRHSLAGLEAAIMLSKWLLSISETVFSMPLTDSETKIIYWIRCIIEEARSVIDFEKENVGSNLDAFKMNQAVLRIWAHFFRRNTLYPFINTMGDGLEKYRQLLNGQPI